jgi:undecaprenyl-diphosphatase
MIRLIAESDRRVMRRMNRWAAPRWFRVWMLGASKAGDWSLWVSLGGLVLLFGGERRFEALIAGGVSSLAGWGVFWLMKRLTGRERPCATETHCWSTLLPPDRFSFPSGHTIMAFAAAVPVGLVYRELFPVLLFCALSVAASRIVLGLHYLSDVMAGMVIGSAIGVIVFRSIIPA